MNRLYSKSEVVDYVWQYSRHYGNQLIHLNNMSDCAHASVIYMFSLLENILYCVADDFESTFHKIIERLHKEGKISSTEKEFINKIRDIRNKFAHKNLSRFNLILAGQGPLLPFTESETAEDIYKLLSDAVFNIILKLVSMGFIEKLSLDVDKLIATLDFEIVELTPDQLLKCKGIDPSTLPGWDTLQESDKYRLAENASDVNVLTWVMSGINNELRK